MSQSDQVLCRRIARVTLDKKLPEKRKASIQILLRDRKLAASPESAETTAPPAGQF